MSADRPHLLHVFSTFVAAGPQVRTVGLISRLGERFRHSLLAMDGRTDALELLPAGAVRLLPPPPRAGTPATVVRMRRLLRAERPDLVLTYNFGAMDAALAARTLGLSLVHHEDGFLPDEAHRQVPRRAAYRRLALRRARSVVVISETLRSIAVGTWRLDPGRVSYVPNGIDLARFSPDRDPAGARALRERLGIPPGALVVGAVGHLRPEKNLPRLVEACALAVDGLDLHLVILGDGPERERIERAAAVPSLAGRVHLVGHHRDPRDHYLAMDVFASSSDTEQMPISLLEAMASALPVVATDVGDVRSMLPEEQRRLVTASDEATGGTRALAASLAALAADPDLRRRLGAANRSRVRERFDLEVMTGAYRDLYDAALRGRAARA